MFIEYFYYLRDILPVSIIEYLTLIDALDKGLINNMVEFYYVSRSILCKNEHHFDLYDVAFVNFFKDASLQFPLKFNENLLEWLEKNIQILRLPAIYENMFQNVDLEDLERQFRELLKKQDREHNYGDKWIGTQGQSQFGHSGQNLLGLSLSDESGLGRAVIIAQKRIFKDYSKDLVLGTRQLKIALKRLRKLDEIGKRDELNLDKTIEKTCKNGGDIEIVFEKRRKNNVKLLLLMDVGGTMDPHIHKVNLLFSAANNMSHWKKFAYYYFHNCIYNRLYDDARRDEERSIEFDDLLKKYDSSYRVIIVGDQTMHRSELKNPHGAIYDDASNKRSGIYYVKKLEEHFKNNVVWLSPEPNPYDWSCWTQLVISKKLPTFPLTVGGIEKAMDYLKTKGKNQFTTIDMLRGVPLAYY